MYNIQKIFLKKLYGISRIKWCSIAGFFVDISIEIEDSTNIFDVLDSMDIVNLIMETEALLEEKLGYYLPLANEETFDAEKSPLLSYKSWLQFIFTLINNNAR